MNDEKLMDEVEQFYQEEKQRILSEFVERIWERRGEFLESSDEQRFKEILDEEASKE